VYAFDGVVGESVIFDLLAGSNVALGWELAAPDGSVLFDRFRGDRQLVLPATGVYSLSVRGNNPDDTGTYSFQLLESPPNSPPEIAPIADQTNTEGDDVTIPISAGDPDGDPLTITATGLPPGIIVDAGRLTGTLIVGSASPAPYTVEIIASDPLGATAVSTFAWSIELGNTAPTAVDDQAVTDIGTPVVIDVLANDTDLDGDPLHIVSTSQPLHGGADIEQDGVRYTPGAGHTGSDTFTYMVADGRGGLSEATVTVTVLPPPNSPPVIAPIADQTNTEGDDVTIPISAGDPDGDPLTITAVGLPPGVDVEASPGTSPTLSGSIAGGSASASPYTSTVTVTDADGADEASTFTWTIDPPGTTPGSIVAAVEVFAPWVCTGHPGTGSIVVVIHGSGLLPAEQIDAGSIELEGMPVARLFGLPLAFRADVDHDGLDDLVAVVRDLGGIRTGADPAIVTGRLIDGSMFTGSDEICRHARGIR
jgi:hypothetical protein